MERDPVRDALSRHIWRNGTSLAEASLAIGRNRAYLQQYIARRMPRVLSYQDSEALGRLLDCDPAELRHDALPPPSARKPGRRLPRIRGAVSVAEVEIEAAAGPGALTEDLVIERARWGLPEAMIRHEGDAEPAALRILRVRGNSMEPELREGDRLVVDTARRVPAAGELFVLWDGDGLVVKRVEPAREDGEPVLRLISSNPGYAPYTRRAEDIHIGGKVLWKITKA